MHDTDKAGSSQVRISPKSHWLGAGVRDDRGCQGQPVAAICGLGQRSGCAAFMKSLGQAGKSGGSPTALASYTLYRMWYS